MKNLLAVLGLRHGATEQDIHSALDEAPPMEPALEDDMHAVLLTDAWRAQYERVHMQYEAMATALAGLSPDSFMDTHQWEQRVVEFEVDAESLDH